jgi:hypothetical protein
MTNQENKARSWLKRASGWLNQFGDGFLSDPANMLLQRLKREFDRSELKKAWDVIDDLNRLSDVSEGSEAAEIRLQCGLVVAEMGNFKESQKFFSDASSKYINSRHHYAVAQWMKGCMEWLLPGKEVDAINSWREAEKIFQGLKQANVNQKDRHAWYLARCEEMHSALHEATDKYEIPPLPDNASENDNLTGNVDIKDDSNSSHLRSDRMGVFCVYEHINAGSFGPSGILEKSARKMEVEHVFIDDKTFRILAINGGRFFSVSPQTTSIVKVLGDSMNKAGIQSGDYVILRSVPKNFRDFAIADDEQNINSFQIFHDGDIVAAEIFDEGGNAATLKRVSRRGKKVVLKPESKNPKYVEREFDATDEGFAICGIVVAILKPV